VAAVKRINSIEMPEVRLRLSSWLLLGSYSAAIRLLYDGYFYLQPEIYQVNIFKL